MRLIIVFLAVLECSFSISQNIHPGSTISDFRKEVPGLIPIYNTYNDEFSVDELLQGFAGSWYFDFKRDTLRSLFFSKNLGKDPLPESTSWFAKLVEDYTNVFGTPVVSIIKDTVLNNNRIRKSNTDTLLHFAWYANKTKFAMGLYFTGNKPLKISNNDLLNQNINSEPTLNYYLFKIDCSPYSEERNDGVWPIYIGMTIMEFSKLRGDLFPNGIGVNGQWQKDVIRGGINGKQSYNFKSDKIDWMLWNSYSDKTDNKEFEKYLRATRKIMVDYDKKYGKATLIKNDTKLSKDNRTLNKTFFEAEWDRSTYIIKLRFSKLSGKGTDTFVIELSEGLN